MQVFLKPRALYLHVWVGMKMTHTEVLESVLHIGVILLLRSATESYQKRHTQNWTERPILWISSNTEAIEGVVGSKVLDYESEAQMPRF